MSLLNLPVELTEAIVGYVYATSGDDHQVIMNQNLLALTLTCKSLHNKLRHRIDRHQAYLRTYSHITIDPAKPDNTTYLSSGPISVTVFVHPVNVLLAIYHDSMVANYVKRVDYAPLSDQDFITGHDDETLRILQGMTENAKFGRWHTPGQDPDLLKYKHSDPYSIVRHSQGFAFLLTLLPVLQHLQIASMDGRHRSPLSYLTEKVEQTRDSPDLLRHTFLPLRSLKTLSYTSCDNAISAWLPFRELKDPPHFRVETLHHKELQLTVPKCRFKKLRSRETRQCTCNADLIVSILVEGNDFQRIACHVCFRYGNITTQGQDNFNLIAEDSALHNALNTMGKVMQVKSGGNDWGIVFWPRKVTKSLIASEKRKLRAGQ